MAHGHVLVAHGTTKWIPNSNGTPWGGLSQSNAEPPSAPIKGERAAPGTDLPPQRGERLPGSNDTLSAEHQGEAVYTHAQELHPER